MRMSVSDAVLWATAVVLVAIGFGYWMGYKTASVGRKMEREKALELRGMLLTRVRELRQALELERERARNGGMGRVLDVDEWLKGKGRMN